MYYGQFRTDEHISKYFDSNYIGTCVDIGASEPIEGNNTYFFESIGWDVYCIEANPNQYRKLKDKRKNVFSFACGCENLEQVEFTICSIFDGQNQGAVSSLRVDERLLSEHMQYNPVLEKVKVRLRTLDSFLEEQSISKIDFISIDTEGTEVDVLKGFNIEKYHPKLLVIENNYNYDELELYLKKYGYIKDKRIEVNDFYILNK
jgi:FkbM family methyltransferase